MTNSIRSLFEKYTKEWAKKISNCDSLNTFLEKYRSEIKVQFENLTHGLNKNEKKIALEIQSEYLDILITLGETQLLGIALGGLKAAIEYEIKNQMSANAKIRFGYRFGYFLCQIGLTKFAQALNSYDFTPKNWLVGLADSKSHAPVMEFYDFSRILREELRSISTEAERLLDDNEISIGEEKGTGAYVQVHELTASPKARKILGIPEDIPLTCQIQKEGLGDDPKGFYEITLTFLEQRGSRRIGKLDPAGLIPIVRELLESLPEEKDFTKVAWKNEACAKSCSKISINIKNIFGIAKNVKKVSVKFDFGKAYWTTKRARITKCMEGNHFHSLETKTEQGRLVQIVVAICMWMKIFQELFSGKIFNPDMHARNFNTMVGEIDGDGTLHILLGLFDEQAVCKAPTERQSLMFVDMLMDGIGAALKYGHNPDQALAESYFNLSRSINRLTGKIFALLKAVVISTDYQRIIDHFFTLPNKTAELYLMMIKAVGVTGAIDMEMARKVSDRFMGICLLKGDKNDSENNAQLLAEEVSRSENQYPLKDSNSAAINYLQKGMLYFMFTSMKKKLTGDWQSPFEMIIKD